MSRECEICERPLKTGRKYCWEHRHTSQANSIKDDSEINFATEVYISNKVKPRDFFKYTFVGSFLLLFISFIGVGSSGKTFWIILLVLAGILLFYSLMVAAGEGKRKRLAEKEIEERSPEYVKWVKSWIKNIREEKEFRKSLLR